MGSFSIWHWVIVLVVVVLIFGTKKLRNVGQDLGGAVKGFKEGMKSEGEEAAQTPPTSGSFSNTVTSKPKDLSTLAVLSPAKPAPMMPTVWVMLGSPQAISWGMAGV